MLLLAPARLTRTKLASFYLYSELKKRRAQREREEQKKAKAAAAPSALNAAKTQKEDELPPHVRYSFLTLHYPVSDLYGSLA